LRRAGTPAEAGDRRLVGFNPKAFVFREDEDFLGNGWGILFPLQGKVPADRFDPALPRVQNVNHVIIL
jgi:hypothetical protein